MYQIEAYIINYYYNPSH